jgi:large subunit ribosomal protein L6
VRMVPPSSISVTLENPTSIIVSGMEKDLVGEFAAKIRSVRPPEPYKGKGIAYEGEFIRRKAGKTGKK